MTTIDKLIKHDIDLLRVSKGHEREVEKRLDDLQRALVGLVANDYNANGPNQDMIKAANVLIDEVFEEIELMVSKGVVELGEYDLETIDGIYDEPAN